MDTKIGMWGNSLGVRIPQSAAEEIGLKDKTPVDVSVRDGKIVIEAAVESRPTLEMLLAGITDDNLYGEVSTGAPVGNEVI